MEGAKVSKSERERGKVETGQSSSDKKRKKKREGEKEVVMIPVVGKKLTCNDQVGTMFLGEQSRREMIDINTTRFIHK